MPEGPLFGGRAERPRAGYALARKHTGTGDRVVPVGKRGTSRNRCRAFPWRKTGSRTDRDNSIRAWRPPGRYRGDARADQRRRWSRANECVTPSPRQAVQHCAGVGHHLRSVRRWYPHAGGCRAPGRHAGPRCSTPYPGRASWGGSGQARRASSGDLHKTVAIQYATCCCGRWRCSCCTS